MPALVLGWVLASGCGPAEIPATRPAATGETSRAAGHTAPRVSAEAYLAAALDGELATVRRALDEGMAVGETDAEGRTALMLAAFNGHTMVVDLLLRTGAEVDRTDAMGRTALMFASSGPNLRAVDLLLDRGARVNEQDAEEHWTPLMFAAAEGLDEIVDRLLAHGADPTVRDADGDTAAFFAANRGFGALAHRLNEAQGAYPATTPPAP